MTKRKTPTLKPVLHLTGDGKGFPSFDAIVALFTALTGRQPTAEEIEEARRTYDKRDADETP